MAIRTVVTRGYGNGTFNGTIPLVVTRGYAIGAAVDPTSQQTGARLIALGVINLTALGIAVEFIARLIVMGVV